MKVTIEIRPGEGGEDAQLLVNTLGSIYLKYAYRNHLKISREQTVNQLTLILSGNEIKISPLLNEAGGHRWQRVPPTEKKGRIHTSTVTVAVFENKENEVYELRTNDITVRTTKDSGAGGQHRNKTESCVVMRHDPTGITVKAAKKSQHQNRKNARIELEKRVLTLQEQITAAKHSSLRKEQVGSGMRGDKIRTYREKDNTVINHLNNSKARYSDIMSGDLEKLWV